MKQTLRPQMSVSLLPGIISAAIVSVNSVMVVCIPVTEVPRSSAIVLIATFMLDPAKLQMNWASAKGRTTAPAASVALMPSVRELVIPVLPDQRRSRAAAGLPVQRGIEGEGGVDERQVREGLGEVADLLAGQGDLLGVQPHVVGVGEHLLERLARIVDPAGTCERVDIGEGAQGEGAL